MPLRFNCGCGKVLNVKEENLGKRMKCPQCGASFTATRESAIHEKGAERTPRFHFSRSVIIYACIIIAVPSIIAAWKFGPGRVLNDWAKMEPDARSDVIDLLTRAIQAHIRQHIVADPSKVRITGHVNDVTFVISPMPWSMPEKIGFAGNSSEGAVFGSYYPATGMIEADVEMGGMGLPGVTLRRGTTRIHVKGQTRKPPVQLAIDGEPVDLATGK